MSSTTTSMHGGQIAIVGAAETDHIGVVPDRSMIQLHAEAARNALADAGLTPADVDGVATAGPLPLEVSHYLGITPRWLDGTMVGGCSFMLHVRHAATAIAAGACETVLITHGESGRSRGPECLTRHPARLRSQDSLSTPTEPCSPTRPSRSRCCASYRNAA